MKLVGRKSYAAEKRMMVYSAPPTYSYAGRSMAMNLGNGPILVVPHHASKNQSPLLISPSPQAEMVQQYSRVRFAVAPEQADGEEGSTEATSGCRCERRREYLGGDHDQLYPTPVREGVYKIATDCNRLATIFSEENPNACSII
ncbi:hypothetical protein Cni_G24704 [Canna indica]|uniref:Uncharacterized protein n=1 Tax=Canna indica TaxID=4628 RepID=A0AAQ3KZF0_9LILI|nr:hypothetical protein Cni_G24704 [Canna indica]